MNARTIKQHNLADAQTASLQFLGEQWQPKGEAGVLLFRSTTATALIGIITGLVGLSSKG